MVSNRLKPGLEIWDYYPEAARASMSIKEARAEYARLRKIANRRLEALQRNFPGSQIAREYKKGFKPFTDKRQSRIYTKLYEVARYLNTQLGSVTGERAYRKRAIESLHERGYMFINKKNFDAFGDFMSAVKTHSTYRSYDSEEVVELFAKAIKKKADPQKVAKAFEYYMSKESPLANVRVRIEGRDEDL